MNSVVRITLAVNTLRDLVAGLAAEDGAARFLWDEAADLADDIGKWCRDARDFQAGT